MKCGREELQIFWSIDVMKMKRWFLIDLLPNSATLEKVDLDFFFFFWSKRVYLVFFEIHLDAGTTHVFIISRSSTELHLLSFLRIMSRQNLY